MGNTDIRLGGAIIHNVDEDCQHFIDEWSNERDYIIAHTSGSTGVPKQICLKKEDMRLSALATCAKFDINADSRLLLPLSTNYIAGKMMVVRAIVSGAELFIEKPSNNPILRDYGVIDLMPIVPSQIPSVVKTQWLSSLKNIIIGGGAISQTQEAMIKESGLRAFATYGMTETCSHVALREIGSGGVYTALPGLTFDVDSRGCLVIEAPGFSFGRTVTNDIVSLVDKRHFEWIGRWDNVINTGGIKVFPEEIERELSDLIKSPFYIIGTPDEKWGETVTLYIESQPIDMEKLRKGIDLAVTNKYAIPKRIVFVDEFKRTHTGKIKRIVL